MKPVTKPRWALTGAGADAANLTTPSSGEQDTGYTSNQIPTSGKLNFLFNWLAKWINFLDDSPAFVPTTTNAPAMSGTGNGTGAGAALTGGATGPAVSATAGGAGAPARGSIAAVPQATPSAPATGDVWVATSSPLENNDSIWVRLIGVSRQLLDVTWGALCSLTFVGNPGNTASTNYFAWGATSQAAVAANGTARANGQTTHMAGFAGQLRGMLIKTGTLTAGGTVTVTLMKNGVATAIAATIGAGTAANTLVTATGGPVSVAAGDVLEVQIANGAGVTASIGVSLITVTLSAG